MGQGILNKAVAGAAGALILCGIWGSGVALAASGSRTSSFAYDAASGLLIQEVIEPNTPALRLQTDYTYDAFGHKTAVTVSGADIATRGSSSTYDAKGQFVTSNTNALGQSETWAYDARFGLPTSHTGPNGLTTTWSYDSFGRKILEVRADGTQTKWAYSYCSGVNGGTATCPTGAAYLLQTTSLAPDGMTPNAPLGVVYYDPLDREVARDTQGFDGSTVRAAKQYDALGRVAQTSRPYFLASGAPRWATYTYDAAGRVVKVVAPDGSVTQTAYHGLSVTETNALNQTRTTVKNSQGQVVSITDALGKTMTYAYDPFGNTVAVTDVVGNVVSASFDTRGRKIGSVDPDMGSWSYSYNVLGQLISETDAKGQIVNMTYDKLNRMVQRVEADMTSVWTYDIATNGIGKLASAGITAGPGAGFQRSFGYDALGRPVQVATTIDGATYAMGATYDANGRLSKVSYPSGFTARYGYNGLGDANQLLDDVTSQVHWTANAMDAEQHLTQQTAGNGLVTTRSFDAATGRLTAIGTGAGSAVQNLAYTYDRLGNPLSRTDGNTNLSESFTYDALNRLTAATVSLSPTPLAKTFTYDAVGNLTSKSDVGTYSYAPPGSPLPHAVMSVSGGTISTTFTYDPNGNQTGGLNRTIAYTSYNKPASITQGARTISFLDDVDHQRFKQVTPEGTTLYIAGFGVLAELSGPGTTAAKWTDYLSVGNAKVGMRVLQAASETLNLRYFHTDHLGSISVITNESGVVQERLSFDAWGKRRNPDGSDDTAGSITSQTTRGFTGEEELSVAGLVHLNGRVYDPLLARMTSTDPTVSDPGNAQRWNRYSYVNNRPLGFVDPSGFDGVIALPEIIVPYTPDVPGSGSACCVAIGNSPYFPSLSQQVANTANAIINAPLPVIPSLLVPPPVSTAWVGPSPSALMGTYVPYVPAAAPSVANPASVASAASPSTMLPAITVDAPSARNLVEPRGKSRGSSFVGAGGAGFAFTTDAYAYVSGTLHWGLTAGSFAPSLIGSAFSLGDAGLYALEGDGTGAAISLGAAVLGIAFDAGAVKLAAEAGAGAKPFAMGLEGGLDAFAGVRGATTWKEFADPMNWKSGVIDKLADPNTAVHFNLDGVDVWGGLSRAATGRGGATDWELMQIRQNPQWWDTLQFWRGGSPAPNPFAK